MTESDYKKQLSETHNGNVTLISRYLNLKSAGVFECRMCGVKFYNRLLHMIGDFTGQHHLCGKKYASTNSNCRIEGRARKRKRG